MTLFITGAMTCPGNQYGACPDGARVPRVPGHVAMCASCAAKEIEVEEILQALVERGVTPEQAHDWLAKRRAAVPPQDPPAKCPRCNGQEWVYTLSSYKKIPCPLCKPSGRKARE